MRTQAVWGNFADEIDESADWSAARHDPVDACREELAVIVDHYASVAEVAA